MHEYKKKKKKKKKKRLILDSFLKNILVCKRLMGSVTLLSHCLQNP